MADADRVVTQHDDANRAIGTLREIATVLKRVGDDNLALDREVHHLRSNLDAANAAVTADGVLRGRIADLEGAVADFGRGIIDRDELIALARETNV